MKERHLGKFFFCQLFRMVILHRSSSTHFEMPKKVIVNRSNAHSHLSKEMARGVCASVVEVKKAEVREDASSPVSVKYAKF